MPPGGWLREIDRKTSCFTILELVTKAYSRYVSQDSTEKAKLLKMLFSNCSVDSVSVTPTYRKPFDMIPFQAACKTCQSVRLRYRSASALRLGVSRSAH